MKMPSDGGWVSTQKKEKEKDREAEKWTGNWLEKAGYYLLYITRPKIKKASLILSLSFTHIPCLLHEENFRQDTQTTIFFQYFLFLKLVNHKIQLH